MARSEVIAQQPKVVERILHKSVGFVNGIEERYTLTQYSDGSTTFHHCWLKTDVTIKSEPADPDLAHSLQWDWGYYHIGAGSYRGIDFREHI